MKTKTLHRAMNEVLTPEEYKEFCRAFDEAVEPPTSDQNLLHGIHWKRAMLQANYYDMSYHRILFRAFIWAKDKKGRPYWGNIYSRLLDARVATS